MARQWQAISSEQAKRHPLYGVKNWLAVFAFGVLIVPLREVGALNGAAHSAGLTLPQLLGQNDSFSTYVKLVLAAELVMAVVILWLLFTKHPRFRTVATFVWLAFWPLLAVFALATQAPGSGEGLVLGLITWALSCAVWVTYLQRSQRVRVTFEHFVLVVQSTAPSSQVPVAQTAAAPNTRVRLTAAEPIRVVAAASETGLVVPADTPHEQFWSEALVEFDGASRRPGLWARAFAEAQGNEAVGKANYLRYRADELQQEHAVRLELNRRSVEAAERATALAHLSAKQREYAELPKGVCPSCDDIVLQSADPCPKCGAMFGPGSAWKVRPIDESKQVELLGARYLSGRELTADELIFLARASSHHASLVSLTDRHRTQTLLHWAAKFGLHDEASLLIANGADPAAPDSTGQRPFELAQDVKLRESLLVALPDWVRAETPSR